MAPRVGVSDSFIQTSQQRPVNVIGGQLSKFSLDGHNPVFADFTTRGRALISREMIE